MARRARSLIGSAAMRDCTVSEFARDQSLVESQSVER
jgi:hypothetical protein